MLSYWLPLNGNLENNGLSSLSPVQSDILSYSDNGKIGKCFQSGSQYISLPLVSVPTSLSICFWVKPNSPYAWTDIFSLGIGNNRFEVDNVDGGYYWFADDVSLCSSGTYLFSMDDSEWYHICMTADGNNVKFYVNGSLIKVMTQTNTFSTVFGDTLKINIGSRILGGNMFQGYINDFRVYIDEVISLKLLQQIKSALVCHYKLSSQYETGQKNKYSGDYAEGRYYAKTDSLTVTKLENERGYNYKLSYTGTGSNAWTNFQLPFFTFTVGKTYYYSCKVRCHSTNDIGVLWLRAARSGNDWTTRAINVLIADGEWHEYYVYQTINETYDRSGDTITCNPCLEFFTENLSANGTEYFADFDLKDVQVIESDCYVPFIDNDFSSTAVSDCSGFGNDGKIIGNITWDGDSPRYSGSYDFNGTGYIKNDTFDLTTTEFTIAFWLKIPSVTTSQHFLFGTFDSWCNNGIGYCRDKDSLTYSILIKSNAEDTYSHTYVDFTADKWTHVAIVYTGTEILRYKDGVLDYTVTYGSNGTVIHPTCYVGNSLYINTPSSETDESSVSDFRIYATTLSEDSIKELFQVGASIDSSGNLYASEFEEV